MPIFVPSSGYAGDPTLSEIVDRVAADLSGYVRNQAQQTHLTVDMTTTDLTVTVNDATQVSAGLIEIEDELLWLDSVDRSTQIATVAPYGRGYNTSVNSAHLSNTRVLNNPLFPRKAVADAVNDCVLALADQLYAVAYEDFTYNPAVQSYTLPSGTRDIIGVVQQSIGPSQTWFAVTHWRPNQFSAAGTDSGTQSIEIREGLFSGQTFRVTYTTDPLPFQQMTSQLSTTGLGSGCKDILIYGAKWRLASNIDAARIDVSSAMADSQDSNIQVGTGMALAKGFYAMYQQRVAEERSRLLAAYSTLAFYPQD